MNNSLVFGAVLATAFSLQTSAFGQADSLSHANKVGTISLESDSVNDCAQLGEDDPKRRESIERQYTSLEFDTCMWTASVDKNDLSAVVALFRAGAEVSCTLEEVPGGSAIEIQEQSLPLHLRAKGMDEVTIVSSSEGARFGGTLMRQVIRALPPFQGLSPERPVYGLRAWIWSDPGRMVSFICIGPEMAIQADAAVVDEVGGSMTIKPVVTQ